MSQEIQVSASLTYTNAAFNIAAQLLSRLANFTITGKNFNAGTASVGTSAAAIPLGGLANVGWCMFYNLDATNYVELKTATGGTVFCQLMPGEIALFRLDPSVTAPAWVAHTGACEVQFLMLEI